MSTVHASCVLLGDAGVLIRGASGAGKSRLAHILLLRAPLFGLPARLVADDRVLLRTEGNALFARAPEPIAGLLEVRGLGLVRFPHAAEARLAIAIDLLPEAEIPRMPDAAQSQIRLEGVTLPRAFACTPEGGLDILLTINGHSEATLSPPVSLASVRFDGKTKRS